MATVNRKFQTGKLPAAIAKTAKQVADRAEFLKSVTELKIDANLSRAVWFGFKVPKTAKNGDTINANFYAIVPVLDQTLLSAVENGEKFLSSLIHDYQDSKLVDCVNNESDIDPTDLEALVKDYFDTSRASGLTQKDFVEWSADVFEPAFIERRIELNQQPDVKHFSDDEIAQLVNAYKDRIKQIAGRNCKVSRDNIRVVRQAVSKLVELGKVADDQMSQAFIAKCEDWLKADSEVLSEAI